MKAPFVTTTISAAAVSIALLGCSPADATREATPAAVPTAGDLGVENDRIETYVRARFQADDAIRMSDIDVSAENGRVTLHGTVPTEDARQRAVTTAREVSGVQSIDDQLSVAGTAATATAVSPASPAADQPSTAAPDRTREPGSITTMVQAQYFANPEIRPWNIDVTTASNGVVTLRGEVNEARDRDEAVRIARSVEGVTQVDDRLVVRQGAGAAAQRGNTTVAPATEGTHPDAWVTAKIQAKYFLDAEVKGLDIDVDTQNGVVTLRGQVSDEAERRQAIALARNTEGAREVADQLVVTHQADTGASQTGLARAAATVDDAWITTKVQSKFFLDRDIKGSAIDVNTSGGVVTLEGRVRSDAERQAAEQIARETDGVTRVNNQLKVDATR